MKLGTCYYPEHWPQEMWEGDAARMVEMGITHVRIGEFAWSRIEPSRDNFKWDWLDKAIDVLASAGLQITMSTPTATPPKWLVDETPDMLAYTADGQPRRFGSRRHYCFSSQTYRAESRRITEAVLKRYVANPAITSWQTDNEYGCHDTVESYSPWAEKAFQKWLEAKYKTIGVLNAAWGTVFWSQEYQDFGQIQFTDRTVTEANPAHRLDFQRFSSDQVISFNKEQTDIIREHTKADITHNVMGHFTAFDHYKLGADLDITTWDSYPLGFMDQEWWTDAQKLRWMRSGHPDFAAFHHDLYRACSKGRWGVMEQQPGPVNWAPNNPAPRDGMVGLWALEAAAHGAEYCSYFRWRQAPFAQEQNHAGLYDSNNHLAQGGVEAKAAHEVLEKLGELKPHRAEVALIFDYEAKWMFDIQPQGTGWHYEKICFEFYTTLRRMGLSVDIISPHQELTGYNLAIAPSLPVMPITLLSRAKQAGTKLFFGPRSGTKTADYQIPEQSPLSAIHHRRSESLREGSLLEIEMDEQFYRSKIWRDFIDESENVKARFEDGLPAFVETEDYDYLATWPEPKWLRALLRQVLNQQNIETFWLPKDLRLRRTDSAVFAFNYGANDIDLSRFAKSVDFIHGDHILAPARTAIWKA
ncbi:beta-galactosidase [Hellea balneolensis]|uniref:beta-galactosidase n=1 Tax=Hellea balneolensis TaxID=287478 RepID=UPI00047DD028|nr:beta-galactosidase [Hellea balneolensis]